VVGDASRLRARLGWRPQVGLERTLFEILAHQRAMVAAG
jgi:nucleoside-diphosphate-sugar epimerase